VSLFILARLLERSGIVNSKTPHSDVDFSRKFSSRYAPV